MRTILCIFFVLSLFSCTTQKKSSFETNKQHFDAPLIESNPVQLLVEQKCYSCHDPKSQSHANIIAPPLAAIKKKYKKTYASKELFVSKFSAFILNPTEKETIGPTHKFGLMPKIILTTEEAKSIANYVYHTALPYPKWLPKHWEEKHEGKF